MYFVLLALVKTGSKFWYCIWGKNALQRSTSWFSFEMLYPLDQKQVHAKIPSPIGAVAQLVRVPACRAGCCGFESRPPRLQKTQLLRRHVFSTTFYLHSAQFLPIEASATIGTSRDIADSITSTRRSRTAGASSTGASTTSSS